ncbi:Tetratricopeptide (TPR) repeat [Glycomyces harbinensis]|uniref:Tetratricopeptide (TPR) repeat n=1 Tax=Glycomyces harbinensis TaxID=58114 RepID=A0A1G6QVV3_9ACTN|nr:Tetratricopeptide (TPR) repeat [Glycomyces harbinensis]
MRSALGFVVEDGVKEAARALFTDAEDQASFERALLERDRDDWPLVNGSYPIDLAEEICIWVATIKAPPDETGQIPPIDPDHEFVAPLLLAILAQFKHWAQRRGDDSPLAEMWSNYRHDLAALTSSVPAMEGPQDGAIQETLASASRKSTIPTPLRYLVGRASEVNALAAGARRAAAGDGPFVALVHGRGGAGKSVLVHQAAADASEDFPEWQLYVSLHSWTPGQPRRTPANLLEELLHQARHLTIPPDLATRVDRWRNWMAEHQALVILDDVLDAAQVSELMPPAGSRCALMMTSRNTLTGLRLPGDQSIEARPLKPSDAVALLRHGNDADLDQGDLDALAAAVNHNPKALDALGQQLRSVQPSLLLQRVKDAGSDVLEVMYREALQQLASDVFRRTAYACGFHPGPDFEAASIGAITGASEYTTAEHLRMLASHHLVKTLPHYRFQLHDQDAKFVPTIAAEADLQGPEEARDRLVAWMRQRVSAAVSQIWGTNTTTEPAALTDEHAFTGPGPAEAWLNAATAEILATTLAAIDAQHVDAVTLADEFARWLRLTNRYDLATVVLADLSENPNLDGQIKAAAGLGRIAQFRGRWQQAAVHYQTLLRLTDGTDNPEYLRDRAGNHIGLGRIARLQDRWPEAEEHFQTALRLAEATEHAFAESRALIGLADLARLQGQLDEADRLFQQALDIFQNTNDQPVQAIALSGRGAVAREQHRWIEAEDFYKEALRIAQAINDRIAQSIAMRGIGATARAQHNWEEAQAHYQAAIDFADATGDQVGRAMAFEGLARMHTAAERNDEARAALDIALKHYRELDWTERIDRCLHAFDLY